MAVHDRDDELTLSRDLDNSKQVDYLIQSLGRIINAGHSRSVFATVDVGGRAFPNVKVPMASIVAYYKTKGIHFEVTTIDDLGGAAQIFRPLVAADYLGKMNIDTLSKIWMFDSDSAVPLSDLLARDCFERTPFGPGSFEAFNWCLWEVMDNVLQHSEADSGFIEVQIHPATKRLAICVADTGIGIYKTFLDSAHRPSNAVDARTLSIQENVTSDPEKGQGNGLWGLHRLASLYDGTLALTSGIGSLRVTGNGDVTTESDRTYLSRTNPGTFVDFQLDIGSTIDMVSALGFTPADQVLDLYTSEGEGSIIRVAETTKGFGSRKAAAGLRNTIVNLMRTNGIPVILDMDGVAVVSSSFADECIGKLVSQLGIVRFGQAVHIIKANNIVRGLIDRAVVLRLST